MKAKEPGANVLDLLVVELDIVVVLSRAESIRLVDLCRLWQLAVRLQVPRLVGRILLDDVCLVVLEVSQREQDDVSLVDPDLCAWFRVS